MQTVSGPSPVGYTDRLAVKTPPWHGLVDWDVLFNGLSTGLFTVAAVAELLLPAQFDGLSRVAYPVVLALLTADLVCLVLDLGDPWRFHHMLRVFKPSSPMSFGTWSLTAFSVPLTLFIAIDLIVPRVWQDVPWLRPALLIGGIIAGFGAGAYKGVLFSTTAQPGWKDARWLGAYLLSGALLLGCAEFLLIAEVGGFAPHADLLRTVLIVLLAFTLVPKCLVMSELGPTMVRAHGPEATGTGFGFLLCFGVFLPLGLLVFGGSSFPSVLAVAAILVSGFFARATIIGLPRAVGTAVEAGPRRRPHEPKGLTTGRTAVAH